MSTVAHSLPAASQRRDAACYATHAGFVPAAALRDASGAWTGDPVRLRLHATAT